MSFAMLHSIQFLTHFDINKPKNTLIHINYTQGQPNRPKMAVTEIGHVYRYAEIAKNSSIGFSPFKLGHFGVLGQFVTKNLPFWDSCIGLVTNQPIMAKWSISDTLAFISFINNMPIWHSKHIHIRDVTYLSHSRFGNPRVLYGITRKVLFQHNFCLNTSLNSRRCINPNINCGIDTANPFFIKTHQI